MPKSLKQPPSILQIFQESSLPSLETELLLAFLLQKNREFILTHPETKLSVSLKNKFKKLELKRHQFWPLAYLIGKKAFYGLDFKVSPDVLTPRPETEFMVEQALSLVKSSSAKNISLIDLGTGSGAIICSVAWELKRQATIFKKCQFSAVDISLRALKIARLNSRLFGLDDKIKFYQGDLLSPIKPRLFQSIKTDLIITANLPYLTPVQIKAAPSISQEPRLALDGGYDGLKYYRRLFKQLTNLKPKNSIDLLCEIDPLSALKMTKLAKQYFPDSICRLEKDLSKRIRFIKIRINNT